MKKYISDEDWEIMKSHYIREFDKYTIINGMQLDIEWLDNLLDKSWNMWNEGHFHSIDHFIKSLDTQFQDFSNLLKKIK
tara:strand:- start:137 stop:373 length:237 start_codon:yes stop_codon:yes gene_type:complete